LVKQTLADNDNHIQSKALHVFGR